MRLRACWPCRCRLPRRSRPARSTGAVKDTSGAVLPGVTVEALSLATGAIAVDRRHRWTGVYRFIGLRPGKYEISAKLQGFTTAKVQQRRPSTRPGADGRARPCGRRRRGDGLGHGRVAAHRHQAERAAVRNPRRADRTAAARARLHVAGHPGAWRERRGEAGWSLDRRRQRRREPLHHRRHRDDDLQDGTSGKNRHRRLRRRSAGQVERLHGGVRRRDGRRHQRRDQERHERLPRHRGLQCRATRRRAVCRWLPAV